jgi:hypothetical protein
MIQKVLGCRMAEEALAVRNTLYCNNSTEEKALLQFHGNAFNIFFIPV